MPPWLVELFAKLSPEGTATSFLGSLATLIALVVVRVMQERKKLDKAMQSIPPTVCPVPEQRDTTIAHARQIWELETQLKAARDERDTVTADATRTAQAHAASEARAQSLADELARIRREIEGGHTRVTVQGVDVVEVDAQPIEDKPTPTQGWARVRR